MIHVLQGDCRDTLKGIPAGSVQCCVTSPPYWGLRSYLTKGHADKSLEIGQEPTPDAYVATMVGVFREVRRCLHDSGTVWLNVGDSYASGGMTADEMAGKRSGNTLNGRRGHADNVLMSQKRAPVTAGLKPKDL